MGRAVDEVNVLRGHARRTRLRCTPAVRAALLGVALAHAGSVLSAPAKVDAGTKRCTYADRRVERHGEAVADLSDRIARQQQLRAGCKTTKACEKADREIRSLDSRKQRLDRQLATYREEAAAACTAPRT